MITKIKKRSFFLGVITFLAFVLWTVALCYVDVGQIGESETAVGFSKLNNFIHSLTGVNMDIYVFTDRLGLVPIGASFGFAVLGLFQWIKRKSILKVDRDLLWLGGFYVAVFAAYAFFEAVVINYRPVLIEGRLEPSYPSSTTMLVMCVMPTVIIQLRTRIENKKLKTLLYVAVIAFVLFMVVGRLLSGVHWFSDIVGGILLSFSLLMIYDSIRFM